MIPNALSAKRKWHGRAAPLPRLGFAPRRPGPGRARPSGCPRGRAVVTPATPVESPQPSLPANVIGLLPGIGLSGGQRPGGIAVVRGLPAGHPDLRVLPQARHRASRGSLPARRRGQARNAEPRAHRARVRDRRVADGAPRAGLRPSSRSRRSGTCWAWATTRSDSGSAWRSTMSNDAKIRGGCDVKRSRRSERTSRPGCRGHREGGRGDGGPVTVVAIAILFA